MMTDAPAMLANAAAPQPSGLRMVDVSQKPNTVRTAVAGGAVRLGEEAFRRVKAHDIHKGDVLTVAQIAGIMGAKQTSHLLPLCHNVSLQGVDVELTLDEDARAVDVRAFAKTLGASGVEMEALTAVSVAALTIYDMCKSVTREIEITGIHLLAKTGGQSGDYRRPPEPQPENGDDEHA